MDLVSWMAELAKAQAALERVCAMAEGETSEWGREAAGEAAFALLKVSDLADKARQAAKK